MLRDIPVRSHKGKTNTTKKTKQMKKTSKIIIFGFLIWLSIFVGAMFIFKLHDSDRVLFETLISIIFTFVVVLYTVLYFKKIQTNFLNVGVKIGIIWMSVNLLIDIPMFSFGPMARPLWDYFKDIGFMYISIPIITTAFGSLLNRKMNNDNLK
jgi:hypothetical protein